MESTFSQTKVPGSFLSQEGPEVCWRSWVQPLRQGLLVCQWGSWMGPSWSLSFLGRLSTAVPGALSVWVLTPAEVHLSPTCLPTGASQSAVLRLPCSATAKSFKENAYSCTPLNLLKQSSGLIRGGFGNYGSKPEAGWLKWAFGDLSCSWDSHMTPPAVGGSGEAFAFSTQRGLWQRYCNSPLLSDSILRPEGHQHGKRSSPRRQRAVLGTH